MRELTTLTPSMEEYESIRIPELKEALQYVFAAGFSHSISDVSYMIELVGYCDCIRSYHNTVDS